MAGLIHEWPSKTHRSATIGPLTGASRRNRLDTMAKAKSTPRIPKVGDQVIPPHSELVYTIWKLSEDGAEAYLYVPGTNLERYRVPVSSLKWPSR